LQVSKKGIYTEGQKQKSLNCNTFTFSSPQNVLVGAIRRQIRRTDLSYRRVKKTLCKCVSFRIRLLYLLGRTV